jgi:threonylcarbamoyladenosine tRNA methylthiotransferase MtaB
MTRVSLHTLGCKLNYAETSTLGKQFLDRGFQIVPWGEPADVVVLNTCTVTERADRECRQLIRRALRGGGEPYVIVTGCYAQLEPEQIASIQGVDLVLGTVEKSDIFNFVETEFRKEGAPRVHISDPGDLDQFGPAYTTEAGGRTRAYLKIQDGCDYNCSFCTIPLARGGSRSQAMDLCVRQAEDLVRQGYREIVLTGVNVGDYGRKSRRTLLELLGELVRLEGLARLRISSIEPNLLTREVIEFVAAEPVMCKHFHIPLQSGTDPILRAMRRRSTTSAYRALIEHIRSVLPEAGIGADVIVGFPGESDADFDATYAFLQNLPVSYLHVFTYSERPRTPAASMGASVDPHTRHRRNALLRELSRKKRRGFYESMLGKSVPVLMEGDCENGLRFGFTDNYVRVGVPEGAVEQNEIVRVKLEAIEDGICRGVCEVPGELR